MDDTRLIRPVQVIPTSLNAQYRPRHRNFPPRRAAQGRANLNGCLRPRSRDFNSGSRRKVQGYCCALRSPRVKKDVRGCPRQAAVCSSRRRRSRRFCPARRAVGNTVLSTRRTGNSRCCRRPDERDKCAGNNDNAGFTTQRAKHRRYPARGNFPLRTISPATARMRL
ncbi:hypothetical protein BD626DRAFT_75267 [Schizophyllum amplum]|uniref:Uncharacterized protein n=1 Tax=Schizophyllum amplum TaxID=97359 RepID=A0A550BSA9_9AGAR|nr:hypothetical protein BD626DRAFT_75267 [Auriculariopsis ampla]